MVKNNRLCPDSVPISPNEIRQRSDNDQTMNRLWRQDLDAIGTQSAMTYFFKSCPFITTTSRLTGYRPNSTCQCYDFDSTQQNLSRHSHDCKPTRRSQPNLQNGTGRTLLSGVIGRPSRSSRLSNEPSWLRPDNDRTFPISPDSNLDIFIFRVVTLSGLKREP